MMAISPREPIERFATLSKLAEQYDFTVAWLGDSQLIFKNPYVAMTLAARETERIRIGPGVTPLVTRSFTEIANAISGINEVSDGRAILGLGVGDSAARPIGLKPATLAQLREQLSAIRGLCEGEEIEFHGRTIRMRPFTGRIPIYISASQPKMLQLAGAVADGVIVLGAADRSLTEWQLKYIDAGLEESGRDRQDITIDLWLGIAVADDLEHGRQEVRPYATSQARWFSRWKELPDVLKRFEGELHEAYRAYDFSYHVSRQGDHNQIISDDLVDLVAVVGSTEKCAAHIRELSELPIDRVSFLNVPGGRERHLEQLGEDVLPLLAAARSTRRCFKS